MDLAAGVRVGLEAALTEKVTHIERFTSALPKHKTLRFQWMKTPRFG